MATFYSNITSANTPGARVDPVDRTIGGAFITAMLGTFLSEAAKAATDIVVLAHLPSDARILPGSSILHDALTGATDVDVGFVNDPDALIDGVSMVAAGAVSPIDTALDAGRKVWELAGLSEDPGGTLDLILTFNTNMTQAAAVRVAADIHLAS